MKTWLIGTVAVLGVLLLKPALAEAQTQRCEGCDERAFWEEGHAVVKHTFPGEGGLDHWCGDTGEDTTGEQILGGPAKVYDECEGCHDEWIPGMCMFHDPCWSEDEPALASFEAEVDQLVAELVSGSEGETAKPAQELATRLARIPSFTVDRNQARLALNDCQGRLITEWNLPKLALDRLAGL